MRMPILEYAHCLVLGIIRPSVIALLLSLSAAVVSVGNASQKNVIHLKNLGFSGSVINVSN